MSAAREHDTSHDPVTIYYRSRGDLFAVWGIRHVRMNRSTSSRSGSNRTYDSFELSYSSFRVGQLTHVLLKDPVSLFGVIYAASLGQAKVTRAE